MRWPFPRDRSRLKTSSHTFSSTSATKTHNQWKLSGMHSAHYSHSNWVSLKVKRDIVYPILQWRTNGYIFSSPWKNKHAVLELGSDMLTVTFIHFTSNSQIIQDNSEQTCEPLDRNFDLMLDAPNSYDGDFGWKQALNVICHFLRTVPLPNHTYFCHPMKPYLLANGHQSCQTYHSKCSFARNHIHIKE